MNLFFTADEHYGHRNIITYCKRPFSDVIEMREKLIALHNYTVPNVKDSVTVHLGDMFWDTVSAEEAISIVSRLNGKHTFIRGNHGNKLFDRGLLDEYFISIADVKMLHVGERKIWISHYAHRVWPDSHKGAYHLFGHSHGELSVQHGRSLDVGVDVHNFKPLSFDEIEKFMQAIPVPVLPPKEQGLKTWPTDHLEEGSH